MNVCMLVCVCLCPRLLITSDVMWCDIDLSHIIGQISSVFYMAGVVGIVSGRDISIHMHRGN